MTNLLICIEKWTEIIEEGSPIDVIYTDFAKAFDRVSHAKLLQKAKSIGIAGKTLAWIEAFLKGRVQRVRVDDAYSHLAPVKSGIPQGSVLGPTLFVIFINDMPDIIESMCQLFADDAKVFREISCDDECMKLQEDLNKLTEWSNRWNLPFNTDKCKSLHIGRSNRKHKYEMDGTELEQVHHERDLGVIIDDDLKFHKQTAAAIKKANSVLGLMKKTFVSFDKTTFSLLYKSLVRPHLEYCNVIWGPFYKGDIESIEKVQRRATKLVQEVRDLTYGDRLCALDIPSLVYRRKRGDMITAYKLITGKMDIHRDDFFKLTNLTTRGHKYKIFKQHSTKHSRINTFSNRIVADWNGLPEKIVDAPSTDVFKKDLDKFWEDKKYDTPFN